MTKLLENTYRHINIALVNEMAQFCHEMDIDLWEVIRNAATKPFGFQAFFPGPGVGGHCIPIDPNYLSYKVRSTLGRPFQFVELAQSINLQMPAYVVERVADLLNDEGKALRGSTILLLGVTYKPNIADQRESPATPLAQLLLDKGANLVFHDPHVQEWTPNGVSVPRADDLDERARDRRRVGAAAEPQGLRPRGDRLGRQVPVRHQGRDGRPQGHPALISLAASLDVALHGSHAVPQLRTERGQLGADDIVRRTGLGDDAVGDVGDGAVDSLQVGGDPIREPALAAARVDHGEQPGGLEQEHADQRQADVVRDRGDESDEQHDADDSGRHQQLLTGQPHGVSFSLVGAPMRAPILLAKASGDISAATKS